MITKQIFQGIILISCIVFMGFSANNDDMYHNFEDLSQHEKEGTDYDINYQSANSDILIMAIHGGSIESGTSELAQAISKDTFDYYQFVGIKQADNYDLHISSEAFDEPKAVEMVNDSKHTISIHGYKSEDKNTYMGGMDKELAASIKKELQKNGFEVNEPPKQFAGTNKENITNRNSQSKGVQLEISTAQRKAFFEGEDFSSNNRKNKMDEFYDYAEAVQKGIDNR